MTPEWLHLIDPEGGSVVVATSQIVSIRIDYDDTNQPCGTYLLMVVGEQRVRDTFESVCARLFVSSKP
jgi:hypothetical protein